MLCVRVQRWGVSRAEGAGGVNPPRCGEKGFRVFEEQREARRGRWGSNHMERHLGFTLSE